MRRLFLAVAAACFLFGSAAAQMQSQAAQAAKSGTISSAWSCAVPSPVHALPVGDTPDHMYVVRQVKCTATKGEIAGVKEVEGTGTELVDARGNNATGQGLFVEKLANGDTIHVRYDFKGTSKDKVFQTGSNKWSVVGGTGMFKGAKGSGSCTAKGNPDGSANFECQGTYTLM